MIPWQGLTRLSDENQRLKSLKDMLHRYSVSAAEALIERRRRPSMFRLGTAA